MRELLGNVGHEVAGFLRALFLDSERAGLDATGDFSGTPFFGVRFLDDCPFDGADA